MKSAARRDTQNSSRRCASGERQPLLAAAIIVVAVTIAYWPSLAGVFVFDDEPGILRNASIRHLASSFAPPLNSTLGGRPVANATFALNFALSGLDAWSYHTLNLLVHILSALALFGVIRRTLRQVHDKGAGLRPMEADARKLTATTSSACPASGLALAIAVLWALHPLQTEAVTYVVQRVESLMGLFYLLTFYSFIRSLDSPHPRRWRSFAVATCLLGVGTKEVIATAPLLLLLYDRTFVAGGFRAAWLERRGFYLALAATWIPLAALVASTGWDRGGTAGFNLGVAPWAYWLTQFQAISHYLWLTLWPHPLVFDYPTFWIEDAAHVLPYAFVVVALVVGTAWALRYRPALGFLAAWFFVILAPTSVVPGTIQMMAEHRMYLPLAAVLAAVLMGAYKLLGRRSAIALLLAAPALACLTLQRNDVYKSAEALWSETLVRQPNNERAHNNLGNLLAKRGRFSEAIAHFQAAIRLKPSFADAHLNRGNALRQAGRAPEALSEYTAALHLNPKLADAETALGETLDDMGRRDEAISHFNQALRLAPSAAAVHEQLAIALAKAGRIPEAIVHFEQALRLSPADPRVHTNLGNALRAAGRMAEARAHYEEALRLDPQAVEAHHNLANALTQTDHMPAAIAHYEAALTAAPQRADIRNDFGIALMIANRPSDGIAQFERALQTNPNFGDAHLNLAMALQSIGRTKDAATHYEAARRLGVTPPP